ncbi:alanine racemase [Thiocapsa imhoffii]|uniref:Alanine racemase n=1 Tax=Thiocapsa imhoffii TaxID=382777 RepID=A0A9X1B8H9_9GAMM|nr:alanine racemase [Thiocapsa imhoffii]MBK1643986.1 alanine racemase [Thiocapsa imhoffii]
MARPLRARIDLDAVREHYRFAKRLAPRARALAVVKANAYGHGAIAIARALAREADGFAVACVEEALELRESGISAPILLLDGIFSPAELPLIDDARLTPVVHSWPQLEWLRQARPRHRIDCWLKMDSGMHRMGFAPTDFAPAYAALAECRQIGTIVLMSHFARADEPEHPFTARQLHCFEQVCQHLSAPRSLANSAALLSCARSHADWTRPGIMLYGVSPMLHPHPLAASLRPAMTLETALISVREVDAGEPIGYGGRFVCERPTRVGVAAVGYADGYPRHAIDGAPVAVKGQLTRLIGRVSMDLITIDLNGIANAAIGDPVELWGRQVSATALAQASGTIAYQLFTNLNRRVPVVYEGIA